MEMVGLRVVMPWLSAHEVGQLARTCRAMAEAARSVTTRRLRDATQGWENTAVPIENHVDDCLYPQFQYTPFSRPSAAAPPPVAPLLLPFGRSWGGGGGEPEAAETRSGASESEFGGSMVVGSVLRGPGIGCTCAGDCSTVTQSVSDGSRSAEVFRAEGGRSSSWVTPKKRFGLDDLETLDNGSKEKKQRRQEHNGGTADSHGSLHYRNDQQDSTNGFLECCKSFPAEASSCRCGRFIGGQLAYDANSRLRVPSLDPPKSLIAATRSQVDSPSPEIRKETVNSRRVPELGVVDSGAAGGDMEDPPLVMECGPACSCSCRCIYRVSQSGLGVKAKVVRTSFKGWGLCANQAIIKGSFVCEYAGELITTGNARERQKLYDREKLGKHWDGSALLTVREHLPSGQASVRVNVDATRIGNVARFINHSCGGGNLVPCLIRTAGCVIPKLALFARRAISNGEELSYSYGSADVDAGPWKPCFCRAAACKGRLPSECT